jgi:competence ComEA-like helix-hairpin-helix protein
MDGCWWTSRERGALAALGLAGALLLAWRPSPAGSAGIGLEAGRLASYAEWDRRLAHAQQVDVNTADLAELERLPGIGPGLAGRIADHRRTHGPFTHPEDVQDVPGIGPQTYDRIKARLVVE